MKKSIILRSLITAAILAVLATLLTLSVSAASMNVSNGSEFNTAMSKAATGEIDTIILTNDITSTCSSFYPAATRNIIIKSEEGKNYTISSSTMLEVGITSGAYQTNNSLRANVTFKNLTFNMNNAQRAFYVSANGGVLNLDGVTIKNGKRTDNNGGAMSVFGEASLNNVTILDCSVVKSLDTNLCYGGAIYVKGGELTITGGSISNCSSPDLGGAIYSEGGSVSISGTTISNCTAYRGGAIYTADALTLNNANITGNTATFQGGGVYAENSTVTMTGGSISSNTATNNMGGGVALHNGSFILNSGSISSNTAKTSGANVLISETSTFDYYYVSGARVSSGTLTTTSGWPNSTDFYLYNEKLNDNTLNVYVKNLTNSDYSLSADLPRIHNRISDAHYGNYNLIYNVASNIQLASTWNINATKPSTQTQGTNAVAPIFRYIIRSDNGATISASSSGSYTSAESSATMAIIASNSYVEFENITFDANNVSNLRTLCINSGSTVTFGANTCIRGGNSSSNGGGVFVNSASLTLSGGAINNNTSANYGGGVALSNGAKMIINSGEMTGNVAASRGGAINLQDATSSVAASTLTINGGNIYANYSQASSGGAINIGNSISTAQNTVDMYGGAIYNHLSVGQGAIAVRTYTIFNMYGGEIYGNARGSKQSDGSMKEINNRGGAIWVLGGTFNMLKDSTGGSTTVPTIHDNRSTYGVIDIENGTVNLSYGLITNNKLNVSNTTNYGAIWAQKGTLTIGDEIKIYGNRNTSRNQEENIYVSSAADMSLKIGSNLKNKVGIYSKTLTAGTSLATINSGVSGLGGLFVDNSTKALAISGSNVVITDNTAYFVTLLPNEDIISVAGNDTLTVNYADFASLQGDFKQEQFLGLVDVSGYGTQSVTANAIYKVGDTLSASSIVGNLYAVWVDIETLGAASAKIDAYSGLKFITTVNSSILDSLGLTVKSANDEGDGYSRGILLGVVGKNNLVFGGNFGMNATINNAGWLTKEKYTQYTGGNFPLSNGENAFAITLTYKNAENYNKAVSFRGYVTVTVGDNSSTVYSPFNAPDTLQNGDDVTYTFGQHVRSARAVIRSLYFNKKTDTEAQKALGSKYSIALSIAGYTWDGYNTNWANSSYITQTSYEYQPTISLLKDTSVYGKTHSTALANVTKSSRVISGTIEYTSNYSGYTNALSASEKNISLSEYANGKYGYGYYLSFKIKVPVADYTSGATIELAYGTDKRVISGAISGGYANIACRISPDSDSLVLRCDWDGAGTKYEPCVSVLDLTDLKFNNRSGVDAIRELAFAYDRRGAWIQYETYSMSYASNLFGLNTLRISSSSIPEDATSTNIIYLDCAAFINAVYLHSVGEALGDRESIHIVKDTVNRMYYYQPTKSETEEQKKAILADFEAILQPGDLIAYAYTRTDGAEPTDGHTMIYLGDGMMIHCEGAGNFTDGIRWKSSTGKPYDVEEVTGAITYESIYDTLLDSTHTRYLFNGKHRFAIIRPLDTSSTVTDQAQIRLNVLHGVVIEKISSHPYSKTADRGENITITYNITNNATEGRSFTLESTLPSGTTLVSGSLTQAISIKAGETKTVSLTFKVNSGTAYGTKLNFTSAAEGLELNTCTTVVDKGLSSTVINKMTSLVNSEYKFTSTNSFDLMKEIYSYCGATTNTGTAASAYGLWDDIFKLYGSSHVIFASGSSNAGQKIMVPGLYGGCRMLDNEGLTSRIKKLTTDTLLPGDIIVFASNPAATLPSLNNYCNIYVYLGNDTFVTYDGGVKTFTADGKTLTAHSSGGAVKFLDDELTQLFGSAAFAVLRPSLAN